MRQTILKSIAWLLGVLLLAGCGIRASDLGATQEPRIRATVTVEAGRTAQVRMQTAVPATLTATASTQKVAWFSYHGRFVTAQGEDEHWVLRQETQLESCGWFTLQQLEGGQIALLTCYGRYVTAHRNGATARDWLLSQEPELGECGRFTVHDLGDDGIALETCAGRFVTAGNDSEGWEGDLAWSVVGGTSHIREWERFKMLKP